MRVEEHTSLLVDALIDRHDVDQHREQVQQEDDVVVDAVVLLDGLADEEIDDESAEV